MSDFQTQKVLRGIAVAVVPPVIGAAIVFLSVSILGEYGWTLFFVAPLVMGFVSSVIYDPQGGKPFFRSFLVSLWYILFVGVAVIILAIDGLICVLMALPIAIPLSLVGVAAGWSVTNHFAKPKIGIAASVMLLFLIPLMMGFEASDKSRPSIHQVVSTVEIDAPIETVWKNVIEFPQIDKEPEGILRLGFAYPINAKIEGTGVGAIRNCNFNTGPFVEPITAWEAPNLLAFDVKEQPAPMTELTPYKYLHATHLEYIRSQKGQFRLYEKDGRTVVEGTTFYTHDIAPDLYWNLFSEEIIHQIHLRVLNHIKNVSEEDHRTSSPYSLSRR